MIDIFVDSLLCRLCGQKGETINYKIRGLSAWHGKSTREDMTTLSGWGVPRAFHTLLEIFQNVSRNLKKLLKKQPNVALCNEKCSKVARKSKNFFWSDAKICKLYNKSKIVNIFVQFCGVISVAK